MSNYIHDNDKNIQALSEFTRDKLFEIGEKLASMTTLSEDQESDFIKKVQAKVPNLIQDAVDVCKECEINLEHLMIYISIHTKLKAITQKVS